MTRVMFTGPHGTGKSTTALELSRLMPGFLYIPSFAGPVAKEVGFDINKPFTPEDLIFYQEKVFSAFEESFKVNKDNTVMYDRSPLDIAAYLAAGLEGKFHFANYVERFVDRCISLCLDYCDMLILPKADLSETMEDKFNRPTGDTYNRVKFQNRIETYIARIEAAGSKMHIIIIPEEYQYQDRINYILEN